MKIYLLTLNLLFITLLFLNKNSYGIQINREENDYNQHIKSQIELRNQNVKNAFNQLRDNSSPESHDVLNGAIASLSIIAPFFLACEGPVGAILEFIVGCLELSKSLHERDESIKFGNQVANGVQTLIYESNIKYDVSMAVASLKSLKDIVVKFNKLKSETNDSREILYLANSIDIQFTLELAKMIRNDEEALPCVGIWAIAANSHLLFLSHLILESKYYGFTSNETQYHYSNFIDSKKDYLEKIRDIDTYGQIQLETVVKNKKYADEFNFRNQYYNYMKIYVYDISNYWYYLDPLEFPYGVAIENAHVTLSNIFGSAYNGNKQKTNDEIIKLLESKNAYMYNGRFTGFYARNNYCLNHPSGFEYYIPKYLQGRNYSIRKKTEIETSSEGDGKYDSKTNRNGEIKYFKIDSQISFVTAYSANGLKNAKLYQFGIDINGTKIGDTTWYNTSQKVSYPNKIVSTIIPTTSNDCNINCRDYNSQDKIKMVEGAIIGFVNKDIIDENIIIQGITTMVDAQKYIIINSNLPNIVLNNYKSSIKLFKNTKVTYQLTLNSHNNNSVEFKLLLEYKSKSSDPLNINVYYSNNDSSITQNKLQFIYKGLSDDCGNYGDQISQIAFIKLESSKMNFVTIENIGSDILLNSILFKS